jgi:hypothetical protein
MGCKKSLKEILLSTEIGKHMDATAIYILNHPEKYVGNSIDIVEKTLEEAT